jgi:hypothetical protein
MKKKVLNRACALAVLVLTASVVMVQAMDFRIKDGVLVKYRGKAANVVVPEGVTRVSGMMRFQATKALSPSPAREPVTSKP